MNKKNYNNILLYLEEIVMFTLFIKGLKIQKNVREDILDNSKTLHRIDRLEKSWDRINLNLDMNFNATVRDNFLLEIDDSLNDVANEILDIRKNNYDNKNEILSALSDVINNLNTLKDRLNKMIVE